MESCYGKIIIRYESVINSDRKDRIITCARCGYENKKKVGIKVHISRKHNELGKSYDVECPYCPSIFYTLGGLNRHIYDKICPKKKSTIEVKTWPQIWKDICDRNHPGISPLSRE